MNVIGSYKEAVITNIYLCYSYTVILYEEVKQASVAKISYLDISERAIYNVHVRTHITYIMFHLLKPSMLGSNGGSFDIYPIFHCPMPQNASSCRTRKHELSGAWWRRWVQRW